MSPFWIGVSVLALAGGLLWGHGLAPEGSLARALMTLIRWLLWIIVTPLAIVFVVMIPPSILVVGPAYLLVALFLIVLKYVGPD